MSNDETRDPRTYAIIGAAMEVHRQLGYGFLEAVYQESLGMEFEVRGVVCDPQKEIEISYKGRLLKSTYRADFICFGSVIVELKAQSQLTGSDEGQLINYLKATGYEIGLLLNFGTPSLQYRRFIRTPQEIAKTVS